MLGGLGFGMARIVSTPSYELVRVPPPSLPPPLLNQTAGPFPSFKKTKKGKEKKKVCNQYSDVLITNRIRGVTKGFEQDN